MKRSEKWAKISKAKEILRLGETATIRRIKQAYRELAKVHHPDSTTLDEGVETVEMQELNDAYRTLLEHCENHPIPLEKEEGQLDDEDWWMDRFGNDPLWGRDKKEG